MIRLMKGKKIWLRANNRFFIGRLAWVIILGETHRAIFEDLYSPSRVFVVPNLCGSLLYIPTAGKHSRRSISLRG
jgi:hypothetical protein